ncbi:unnamed protein product [Phytomonas sp. EM1]|nr:unnamed protein product [Phytomonas sp. EM1]|eukprot:CCW63848.1 unnamed protein product [Phytomonas sp. isolate EM1]
MSSLGIEKLNQGLSRIVSIRRRPEIRRQYVERLTKGRVFRIGTLHNRELSEEVLRRNRRGFTNAQLNTVAFAPSLYHWLFHRCGIPFAESQRLVEQGRLRVDDVLVTRTRELESQLEWSTFQRLDIQLRPFHGSGEVAWVPALKRALHRSYQFLYLDRGVSLSSEEANPRSFIHRVVTASAVGGSSSSGSNRSGRAETAGISPEAALGLNVLRPIGFIDGLKGLGIITNDVSMIRNWNNEFLGNYGVYDLRFPRGAPVEVIRNAAEDITRTLKEGIQAQLASLAGAPSIPCVCAVKPSPPRAQDLVSELHRDIALLPERILVSTPLMPYRLVKRLQRAQCLIALVRSGPFVLTQPLVQSRSPRPLSPAELGILFTFERRLKVNRMVLSLRQFGEED